jgi:hypothetical protein
MKVLIVVTSHENLGATGQRTGFWLEEFAAPYYVFKDAGAEITLASALGGQPPVDPRSETLDSQTDATRRYMTDRAAQEPMRSGAQATWDSDPHQPRGASSTAALLFSGLLSALPCQSWTFSPTAAISTAKCRGALTPALQAAPSLLASLDSQIVRRQRLSAAAMARDILPPHLPAIDIGEVDDRRTTSREQAPDLDLHYPGNSKPRLDSRRLSHWFRPPRTLPAGCQRPRARR